MPQFNGTVEQLEMSVEQTEATTDYVVAQGISGIWTYRKWNSGIAECWASFTETFTGSHNAGGASSIWNSTGITPENFPITFTEIPAVILCLTDSGANCWGLKSASTKTSAGSIYALCGQSLSNINSSGIICQVSLTVKGRWK